MEAQRPTAVAPERGTTLPKRAGPSARQGPGESRRSLSVGIVDAAVEEFDPFPVEARRSPGSMYGCDQVVDRGPVVWSGRPVGARHPTLGVDDEVPTELERVRRGQARPPPGPQQSPEAFIVRRPHTRRHQARRTP